MTNWRADLFANCDRVGLKGAIIGPRLRLPHPAGGMATLGPIRISPAP